MNRHLLRSIFVVGLLAGSIMAADAAKVQVCAPSRAGAVLGPSPIKARASGNTYTTDTRGCALVAGADVNDFKAQGFITDPQVAYASQLTAAGSVVLPASAYIDSITIQETSGAAITGGWKIGTTAGGTDVVAAAVVGANGLVSVPDVSMLKRVFSSTSPQTLFMGAVTNFTDGPAVNVTVHYSFF